MKKYINTSNYYLSTTASIIQNNTDTGSFDVSDITIDGVALPLEGYYWVDVDFGDASKREIFRIERREGYTLFYDKRISPYGKKTHQSGASVGLRDFSQLLNSLSTNTDNFGEVEQTGDRNILVRGGKVFVSGKANASTGVINVASKSFESLPINSIIYIVLDLDEVAYTFESYTDTEYLTDAGQYPIAKITVGANMISEIEDLRSTMVYGGGEGDMKWAEWKEKFIGGDETHLAKEGNVYDMDNMEQGTNNLYITPSDKIKYDDYQINKQDTLVSGENIHTINGQSILGPGNFPLDTILTVGWDVCQTEDGAATFTFTEHMPLTEDAFIVFSDSGTMLIRGGENPNDYTYDNTTHTIIFNEPLYEDEHAIVWVMYNNSTEQSQIGSADITLKYGENEATFSANQIDDVTVDLETDLGIGDIAHDSTITITQGGLEDQSFSTNQEDDDTINLSGLIPMTQEQYNDEPDTKLTDNNWYFIVEEN